MPAIQMPTSLYPSWFSARWPSPWAAGFCGLVDCFLVLRLAHFYSHIGESKLGKFGMMKQSSRTWEGVVVVDRGARYCSRRTVSLSDSGTQSRPMSLRIIMFQQMYTHLHKKRKGKQGRCSSCGLLGTKYSGEINSRVGGWVGGCRGVGWGDRPTCYVELTWVVPPARVPFPISVVKVIFLARFP